jgi:histidine phosphotransferase ChpT
MEDLDFSLMNYMCSKMCHDFAAPLGAIKMGVEMLEDNASDKETRELLHASVDACIAKLDLFRCLTGFSGAMTKPTVQDIHHVLQRNLNKNIQLDWKIAPAADIAGPAARLLLSMTLIAADTLPRGGGIIVTPSFTITAEGGGVNLKEEVISMMKTSKPPLSSREIISYFAITLARYLGGEISYTFEKENKIKFHVFQRD